MGRSAFAASKPTPPPVAPRVVDVAYGPHARHRLDLWRAKVDGPAPVVVFIHGGGWHGGDKSAVPAEWLQHMLANGISVASINYRFTSMATVPGPLLDGALVDTLLPAARRGDGVGSARLRRVRAQSVRADGTAAEVAANYTRGERVYAIACRVEQVTGTTGPRWQVVALHLG